MCKRILKFELQLSNYRQNIKFSQYCPKFHNFTKIVIFKYTCNFLDQLLHPYKFNGRDMSGILFFIFASCEPLIVRFSRIWALKKTKKKKKKTYPAHLKCQYKYSYSFIKSLVVSELRFSAVRGACGALRGRRHFSPCRRNGLSPFIWGSFAYPSDYYNG